MLTFLWKHCKPFPLSSCLGPKERGGVDNCYLQHLVQLFGGPVIQFGPCAYFKVSLSMTYQERLPWIRSYIEWYQKTSHNQRAMMIIFGFECMKRENHLALKGTEKWHRLITDLIIALLKLLALYAIRAVARI